MLFLLNIVFAGLNGTLRGPIYALGLMSKLTKYNIVFQGILMPAMSFYLTSYHNLGMHGVWISKNVVEMALLISYSLKLRKIDWNEIAQNF